MKKLKINIEGEPPTDKDIEKEKTRIKIIVNLFFLAVVACTYLIVIYSPELEDQTTLYGIVYFLCSLLFFGIVFFITFYSKTPLLWNKLKPIINDNQWIELKEFQENNSEAKTYINKLSALGRLPTILEFDALRKWVNTEEDRKRKNKNLEAAKNEAKKAVFVKEQMGFK